MTTGKITYWLSTGLLCLLYAAGAIMYLTQRTMVEAAFGGLGYPTYLINLLIVVKILGPLAVLTRVSVRLSDLAYAGMFFHLLLALSAHLNAGDGGFASALVGLVALVLSFFNQNAGRKMSSPNVPTLRSPAV